MNAKMWTFLWGLLLLGGGPGYTALAAATPAAPVLEETRRIDGPLPGLKLGLRHAFSSQAAAAGSQSLPVLILPGAAVPVSGNPDYPFVPGRSLMTALAQSGFDVWAVDYYGFGASDRYPEMDQPAAGHPPLGDARESADQVDAVVAFLTQERHARSIMLIGDSGGTLVAGVFATRRPEVVSKLILFGPVTPFTTGPDTKAGLPAYDLTTPQDLWSTFTAWSQEAGNPAVLDSTAYAAWADDYLRSDPTSGTRTPPSVRVPNGRQADLVAVASGRFPYNPGEVKAPTLIVMGEWDEIATFAGAEWLLHGLRQAASRKLVVLGRGSHTIQYEVEREPLYRELVAFLKPATERVRTLKIQGVGALSGPAHSFGLNSQAALRAAAAQINRLGGVRLGDGATGLIDVSYEDDHCRAADGIAIVQRAAAGDALAAIGPSCSAVAEALYAQLQHTVGDQSDHGIQLPVFTDSAMQAHLARTSEWAFRNTPDETEMYTVLWAWVRRHYPQLRTLYGGEESDFAHSHTTWSNIIGPTASAAGMQVVGATQWSLTDSVFTSQVARMKAAGTDVVVISGHAATTCGVLGEMARQSFRPRLVVGLTSASTNETLRQCGPDADGLLVPTSFAPRGAASSAAARAVEQAGGIADLHSMAAWEILHTLAQVIEREGILGTPESLASDRRKLRAGLAALATMDGLLGSIQRLPDRESRKPFVLVQARHGAWQVVHTSTGVVPQSASE
jgi:branched-chain amino acid transport system substrate-binding protein